MRKPRIKISFYRSIISSGESPFILRAYADTIEAGFASRDEFILNDDMRVLLARSGDKQAGVLIFGRWESYDTLWVWLGYVAPEFRRQGIYRALWARLVKMAKSEDIRKIGGAARVNNAAMARLNRELGRRAVYTTYEYTL
jgi:GNAT superfamily N-acetyltransferase